MAIPSEALAMPFLMDHLLWLILLFIGIQFLAWSYEDYALGWLLHKLAIHSQDSAFVRGVALILSRKGTYARLLWVKSNQSRIPSVLLPTVKRILLARLIEVWAMMAWLLVMFLPAIIHWLGWRL